MNEFLRELCAWLNGNRLGRKILFCRSTAAGNQLLRMAAESGTPAVNTEAVSVQECMNRLAEPALAGRGLCRIDHVTACIALRQIMERAGDAFTTLGTVELNTAESVLPQLDELERSGIAPEDLERAGEPLLARVWRDYMNWRQENGYASAEQILEAASVPDGVSCAILSNLRLSGTEQRFLRTIPSGRLTVIPVKTPRGEAVPRNAVYQAAAPEGGDIPTPDCVECQDIAAEIRSALQYLPENGIPAEDAVIVCPDQSYALRVEETGKLLGIGVASAFGTPASMSKTALLLRCLLDWARRNYDAEALTPALVSAAMALYGERRKVLVHSQRLLRMFRSERVGWGAERWAQLADSQKEDEALAGGLMAEWAGLFEAGEMPVRVIALKLADLLNRCMPRGPENEYYLNIVDQLSRIYSGKMDCAGYLQLVQTVADTGNIGAQATEEPGKAYCCAYQNAMYVNRRHFILLGMSWDAFDRLGREFPLLHDREKEALSPALSLAGDTAREMRYAVKELLTNRSDAVVLFSRARTDRVGGEELMASSLFDAAAKKYPAGAVPQVNILGRRPLTDLDVRLASGFTFSGESPETDSGRRELWRQAFEERIWTATQLEIANSCPRRFMLSVQMGIREEDPQPLEQFSQTWLGAKDRGTLVHEVLEQYFSQTAPRVEAPDFALLERLANEAFEKYRRLIPVPANLKDTGPETESILKVLRQEALLHAADARRCTIETEYAFGSEKPVELTFGSHRIRIRGVIDRVDLVGSDYEIVDYKTGSPYWFRKDLESKLQYYLYTLAWEQLHPLQPVSAATYVLLDGANGIEPEAIGMTDGERIRKYETMEALLDLLSDADQAFTGCSAWHGTGDDPDCESCPGYCPFLEICRGTRWPCAPADPEDFGPGGSGDDLYDGEEYR